MQAEHDGAPLPDHVPAPQVLQAEAPLPEYVPPEHVLQLELVLDGLYVPAPHGSRHQLLAEVPHGALPPLGEAQVPPHV